jgi:hypothetical protein
VATEVPQCVNSGGIVLRRQTTFWDLIGREGTDRVRAHFEQKAEFCFVRETFDTASLVASHPILLDHVEPFEDICISSPVPNPDQVLLELRTAAADFFGGWRPIERYLNPDYPTRKLLDEGFGLLLRAPSSFADTCRRVLVQAGVRVDAPLQPRPPPRQLSRGLILGANFVVAAGFRFEVL